MHLKSHKRIGFQIAPLSRKREPHAFHYLKQRASFWIAALSIIAFVSGNMVGQHGWYAFWKSVLGDMDDSLIVYTGTVTPIEKVPDYEYWSTFGGNIYEHTYRQVPSNVLRSLPVYNQKTQQSEVLSHGQGNDVYSVGYLGSYSTGAENSGSHPGIDIRVPIGTPVRAMANGIVEVVKENGGFGKLIVIRHPNVPDPDNPIRTTTLYSCYAHLNAIYVEEGDIVHREEHIADSGNSGLVSGPHLHFQIDRESAPWHPYWPFTDEEASREGMNMGQAVDSEFFQGRARQYTVNSMFYAQANYTSNTLIAQANTVQEQELEEVVVLEEKPVLTAAERRAQIRTQLQNAREDRLRLRLIRQKFVDRRIAKAEPEPVKEVPAPVVDPEPTPEPVQVVLSTETIASASAEESSTVTSSAVASIEIRHDGSYTGRGWEKITLTLVDDQGNKVTSPDMNQDLYLRTAYGVAEFRPSRLSVLDFVQGEVTVNVLPRGRRTIVIQIQPFNVLSTPMVYGLE